MLRPSIRGGVPVFSRPTESGSSRRRAASLFDGGSPARPPAWLSRPTWIFPPRNVPTVNTTVRARNSMPLNVTHPTTRSASSTRSAASCWKSCKFGCVSSSRRMAALVELAVGLRPSGAYRRPLAGIQGAQLDACLVRRDRHRAAERIDLLDQMTLADAADRRIAAHLPEGLDVVREQERAAAHARGRERRLGAGVAAADHDHVEFAVESHRHESQDFSSKGAYCKPSAAKVPGGRRGTGPGDWERALGTKRLCRNLRSNAANAA